MSSRRRGKLGEFIVLKRGYDLPRSLRRPGRIPLISSSGISDHVDLPKVAGPGVVTGRYGTIGKVFFCRGDYWPLNTTLYVSDFKGNDPRFISYFLQTINFLSASDKAAVPGVNRNHLHELDVEIPSIESQASISTTLGALDDRIELLRATNSTLEAIAQALFKSWFVDFDPVRAKSEGRVPEGMDAAAAALFPDSFEDSPIGPIPKGWKLGKLGDIATVVGRRVDPSSLANDLPYVGLEHVPRRSLALDRWSTSSEVESTKSEFQRGDVLFGRLRPYFHKVSIAPFSGICSTDILVLRSRDTDFSEFVPMHLFSEELISYAVRLSNGAKMPRTNAADLTNYAVVVPPAAVAGAFRDATHGPLRRIVDSSHEIACLSEIRDALLPRLVSGRLRVPVPEGDA